MFAEFTTALYDVLMAASGLFCHQLPDRSPHLFGVQLPLCWRCSGIALGAWTLLIYILRAHARPPLSVSFVLASLLPLDVAGAVLGFWPGSNAVRFVTGLLWGFFGASALLGVVVRACAERPRGGAPCPHEPLPVRSAPRRTPQTWVERRFHS